MVLNEVIESLENNPEEFITAVSCSRVRLTLTPTARGVHSGPHEAEPLCWVQNLSCCLSVQSRLSLNRIWARTVAGRGSDCRAVRRQWTLCTVRWWVVGWRVVMTVEVFSRVLVVEGGVPGEMVGQRWGLRLGWGQALALSLRPETQMKQSFRNKNENMVHPLKDWI